MIKKKNIILIIIFLLPLLIVTAGLIASNETMSACADSYVEVDSVTASYLTGFDEYGNPQYLQNVDYNSYFVGSSNPYAKNIEVTFTLSADVVYYKTECVLSGSSISPYTRLETVPSSRKVVYEVNDTGTYNVTCYAYSSEEVLLGEETVTVKSDYDAPEAPTSNSMTAWIAQGVTFDAVIDWSACRDTLSGIKYVIYQIIYDDGSITDSKIINGSPVDRTYIPLTKSAKISVSVYDNAGNYVKKDFVFNKFDGIAPRAPYYVVTPDVEEGTYANKYVIDLTYWADSESGLMPIQHYLMNGVSYEYEDGVGIILEEQKNYSLVFYAMDNVGNRSPYLSLDIPSTAFDVKGPYLNAEEVHAEINLMEEGGICLLTFNASDYKESGIKSAAIAGKNYTFGVQDKTSYLAYSLRFDCFEDNVLRIILTDFAENTTEHVLTIEYFIDEKINKMCQELVATYRTTDFSVFSSAARQKIDEAYMSFNYLLNTSGNSNNDFSKAYNAILELYKPISEVKYVISSVPTYASSIITYTIDQNDFSEYSYGNSLEITMLTLEGEDAGLVEKAGFSSGFSESFVIALTINEQNLTTPLEKGIKFAMNLPSNYIDRNVKLFNKDTGEEVETVVINNKLNFTMKDTTKLTIVISGSKTPTAYNNDSDKFITVFGRRWPMKSFLGIVIGVGGGAVLIIVLLLVLGKRRG